MAFHAADYAICIEDYRTAHDELRDLAMTTEPATARRQPSPPREIATLWSHADAHCVLLWDGANFRLRLIRDRKTVVDHVAVDNTSLFELARRWRQNYEHEGTLPNGGGVAC